MIVLRFTSNYFFPEIDEPEENMPAPGQMRVRSPFNAFIKQYVTAVKEQEEQNIDCENPYYLPHVIDILMKDYMPLIPLWNGFMLEGEGNEKERKITMLRLNSGSTLLRTVY